MKKIYTGMVLVCGVLLAAGCAKKEEVIMKEQVVSEAEIIDYHTDPNIDVVTETPDEVEAEPAEEVSESTLLNEQQLAYYQNASLGIGEEEEEWKGTSLTDTFLIYWHAFEQGNATVEYSLTYYEQIPPTLEQYVAYMEEQKEERLRVWEDIANRKDIIITEKPNNKATVTVKTHTTSHVFEMKKNVNGIWKVIVSNRGN